jgi:hypothetical protein
MPVCCQKSGQASTDSSIYLLGDFRVVCTEVHMVSNDTVRSDWTARPHYTAVELMKLPREERRRILEQAASEARSEYENNESLTDFKAFGDTDLYDETS